MNGLSADPAAQLQQISTEIEKNFDEAGMGTVEEFMDQLDDVVAKAKAGPTQLLKAVQEQVGAIMQKLQAALKDPASIVPSQGPVLACASGCVASEAVTKLRAVKDDTSALMGTMTAMASEVQKPLGDLAGALEKALAQLESSVKGLAKLPKLIQKEIEGKDSPDAVAQIDTTAMKKAVSGADMDGPLSSIAALPELLDGAINVLKSGVEALQGFLETAPGAVRSAFDLPLPLCALRGFMGQAPQLMTDLLAMLEQLQGVSLQPVMDSLSSTKDKLSSFDMETIKSPVKKFTESAGGLVEKLDQTVAAAKMASNAPSMSAMKMPGF